MKYIWCPSFSYPGPYINIPCDTEEDDLVQAKHWDALDRVQEVLVKLGLKFTHAYSYPDGSLYQYVATDMDKVELTKVLDMALVDVPGVWLDGVTGSGNPEERTVTHRFKKDDPVYVQLHDKEPTFPSWPWQDANPGTSEDVLQEMRETHGIWQAMMYYTIREIMDL